MIRSARMTSWFARRWPWLLCLALVLIPRPALAEDKVDRLAQQLASSDDFRVRTQAALALGATKDKRAIEPLCGGVDDDNTSVRAAAAAALGKLKKGGVDCLSTRLKKESSSSVKSVIKKSLKKIKKALKKNASGIRSDTKFYVALDIKNKSSSVSDALVAEKVRSGVSKALKKLDVYALAPEDESPADAKKLLAKHKGVDGFYLMVKASLTYSGDVMKAKLDVSVFTYPARALKGGFNVTAGFSGVEEGDEGAQKELLAEAGRLAAEKLADNAEKFK